jgi:hypothetical protein
MRMVSVDMLNLLWWVIFSFMSLCILDSTTSGCFFNSKFQSSSHHIFTPAIYIEIWYFISVIYFSLCIVCMWYVLCNIHIILILLAHPLRTRWSALFFLVTHIVEWIWWSPLDVFKEDQRITHYIGDTHNTCTLIPMNTGAQTLPLGASSKTGPANPHNCQSHHRRLAVDKSVTYHWKHKRR